MPRGLVKPDAWLHEHGLWKKYSVDWHDQEVLRHATALREAIHAVDPKLQLASLLWDYPVAVDVVDPRAHYYRMLAIGLGRKDKPAWTLPEHTYYSDAGDLKRIIQRIEQDIVAAGAAAADQLLPLRHEQRQVIIFPALFAKRAHLQLGAGGSGQHQDGGEKPLHRE